MIVAILLFVQSLPVAAQAPNRRFYAALGLIRASYVTVGKAGYSGGTGLSYAGNVHPTLGYYFTPKLAIQLSFSNHRNVLYNVSTGTSLTGNVTENVYDFQSSFYAIPIVVQYSLTKKADNRLRIDLLGGMVFSKVNGQLNNTRKLDGLITEYQQTDYYSADIFATAGVGISYAFGSHFELGGQLTGNRNLNSNAAYSSKMSEVRWGMTSSRGIILRYRFNIGK